MLPEKYPVHCLAKFDQGPRGSRRSRSSGLRVIGSEAEQNLEGSTGASRRMDVRYTVPPSGFMLRTLFPSGRALL